MNEKEVGEIRRRIRPDKNSIPCVLGCCVNEKGEIVSQFRQSLAIMQEDELEKLLTLLRKTLSGGIGKNLMDLSFSTQQVADSEELHTGSMKQECSYTLNLDSNAQLDWTADQMTKQTEASSLLDEENTAAESEAED